MKRFVTRALPWIVLLTLVVTACGEAQVPMTTLQSLNNGLATGQRVQPISADGMQFKHVCSTPYDAKNWRVTSSKTLTCELQVTDVMSGTQIEMIHLHIDTSLISLDQSVDGMSIDSMDDKLSSGTEPGILMSEEHPYKVIFAIEGFSKDLISGWGFATGSMGSASISEKRLTEENLRDAGKVYGQKFSFIYKLLVTPKGEAGHVVTFSDEFYVPVGTPPQPTPIPTPKG